MKSYLFKIKFVNHIGKMLGHKVRSEQVSHLIHADVVEVLLAVVLLEQPPEGFLLFLFFQEQLFNHRQERQRPDAGFGFQHVLTIRYELAVHLNLDDLVVDGDAFLCEVDCIPLQPKHLAAAQAIVCRDFHRQAQRVIVKDT